jgi:hypothetical protein
MDQGIYVNFATKWLFKQLHPVQNNTLQTKTKMAEAVLSKTLYLTVKKVTIASILDSFTVKDLPEFWWHDSSLLLVCKTGVGHTEECYHGYLIGLSGHCGIVYC